MYLTFALGPLTTFSPAPTLGLAGGAKVGGAEVLLAIAVDEDGGGGKGGRGPTLAPCFSIEGGKAGLAGFVGGLSGLVGFVDALALNLYA